jgi:hypothetical protein
LLIIFTEWTGTLIKFLKDQLSKLQEYYHLGGHSSSSSNTNSSNSNITPNGIANSSSSSTTNNITANGTNSTSQSATTNGVVNAQPSTPNSNSTSNTQCVPAAAMNEDHKLVLKQWHYCIQLGKLFIVKECSCTIWCQFNIKYVKLNSV